MTTKTTDPKTDVSKRAEKRRRPMLRFEVRDRGQPVDPMKFLPPLRN